VYAGSANGNAVPRRILQGARTLLARTSHYIALDGARDELIVPNPFAQAILFFRAGAAGDEPPTRVIQGPKTMLNAVDNVAVDPVNGEVYTASYPNDAILVYRSDRSGDAAPVRIIHGPKTRLSRPIRVSIDPVNNLIAVVNDQSILTFDRRAAGDVAPLRSLGGARIAVGTRNGTRDVQLYPAGKKLIAGGVIKSSGPETVESTVIGPWAGYSGPGQRFIGVWQYDDQDEAAPWAVLNATPITKVPGNRIALNPAGGEVIVGDAGQISVYHLPEIFRKTE
jgi:hypothetical protein